MLGSTRKSANYDVVDASKLALAFGVVAIHANLIGIGYYGLGRLAVPFFAIMTSYFCFKPHAKPRSEGASVRHTMQRLLLLFTAWQVIYLPFAVQNFNQTVLKQAANPLIAGIKWLILFVLSGEQSGWGQSWYLLACLWGLPILWLLRKILPDKLILIGACLVEVGFVITTSYGAEMMPDKAFWAIKLLLYTFVRLFVYLVIGMLLAKHEASWRQLSTQKLRLGLLLCIAGFIAENVWLALQTHDFMPEEVFMTVPLATLWAIWAMRSKWRVPYAATWRKMSTFIYVAHTIFVWHLFQSPQLGIIERPWLMFLLASLSTSALFGVWLWLAKRTHWRVWQWLV